MAVATKVKHLGDGRILVATHDIGSANTELIVNDSYVNPRILLFVTVAYSAAPTQGGITVVLDSGIAADHDTTLFTGTANARFSVHAPDAEFHIFSDDIIKVTAPAGGVGITAAIAIYTRILD